MNKQFLKRLGDLRVRWVRHPVDGVEGRALRVLIYARFSTKEQRRRTIKAQIEHCKKFLKKLTGLRRNPNYHGRGNLRRTQRQAGHR